MTIDVKPSEPTTRVSMSWLLLYAMAWFGFWLMVMLPGQIMLAQLAARIDPEDKEALTSLFHGVMLTVMVLAVPLIGYYCDRTTLAWGRRRSWALGGLVLAASMFMAVGSVRNVPLVCLMLAVISIGEAAVLVALSAVIADRVPVSQRGRASIAFGVPQVIALAAGMVLITDVVKDVPTSWAVIGMLALIFPLGFLLLCREGPPLPGTQVRGGLRANITPPNVRAAADYYWAMSTRVLINAGNLVGTLYLLFYVGDALKRPDPESAVLTLTLIYLAFCVIAGYVAGLVSDAMGKRKPLVFAGGALQIAAALTLALHPTWPGALIAAGLLGLGYGTFLSVDQALTTDVLPNPRTRARDLGLINAAQHLPIAPLVGYVVLSMTGKNYQLLYLASAVVMAIGVWSVTRIRKVA